MASLLAPSPAPPVKSPAADPPPTVVGGPTAAASSAVAKAVGAAVPPVQRFSWPVTTWFYAHWAKPADERRGDPPTFVSTFGVVDVSDPVAARLRAKAAELSCPGDCEDSDVTVEIKPVVHGLSPVKIIVKGPLSAVQSACNVMAVIARQRPKFWPSGSPPELAKEEALARLKVQCPPMHEIITQREAAFLAKKEAGNKPKRAKH